MNEIIYTSYSQLGSPRIFLHELKEDLRVTKELGWRMFITNLRSQYRQSWLGYFWLLIPPIITMMIWFYLSSLNILNSNVEKNIYPIYVLSGVFIWQTFVESLNCSFQSLTNAKWVLAKIKAPHEAFVLAGLGVVTFNSVIRLFILILFIVTLGVSLKLTFFFVPLGFLAVIIFGLSIGLFFTPIGMLYSDVFNGLNTLAALWFFITPIVYTYSPELDRWKIIQYNPVTPLLITTRNWILTDIAVPQTVFFLIVFFSICLGLFSWILYRLAKPHLVMRFSK